MIKNKLFLAYIILAFNAAFIESSNMVIKNAEIYDGIENNSYQGHILIRDGVIAKISKHQCLMQIRFTMLKEK